MTKGMLEGFYTQTYRQMQINARVRPSMDALLDVTKSAWAIEMLDEAWALSIKNAKCNARATKAKKEF